MGEGENGGFELQERRQGARRAAARVPFPRGRQKLCGGGTGGTQVFTESLQAAGTRVEQGAGEEMEADPRGGGHRERRRPPHPGAPCGEQARSEQALTGRGDFSHCPPLRSFSSPFRFPEMWKVQTTGPAGLAPGVDVGFGKGGPRRPPGLVQALEMAFSCPRGRLRSSQVGGGHPGVGVSIRPWSLRDPQMEGWRRLAGPEMSREPPRDSRVWGALKWSLRPASELPGVGRGGGVSAWTDGDG